jgi:hypothetical protein
MPRAAGEAEPLAVGVAQLRGDALRSKGDSTAWNTPACSARHSRPASTVNRMSAGLAAPSCRMRSISASSVPSMRRTRMPVAR